MDFVPPAHHDTYPSVDPAIADMVGKVVLITGASRGIGKAMAIAFAQAGASGIVLLARSDLSIVKTACEGAKRPGRSLQVVTIATDITKTADVVAAAEQVKQDLGRLDVLINNAGYMENVACSFGDYDPDEWWRSFTVNLRGTYEVTRAFLPLLLECGGDKTIVNVTSIAAHMTDEIMSAYKTTKLALLRLTELIMASYGEQGVIAFAINPGAIVTEMALRLPEEFHHIFVDTPELASHTMVWFVRERREWLAGRYFSCNWDVDELEAKKQDIVDGDKLKVRLVV
ncbi:putative oxidoreductase [Fomitopsis betulina]|nr:putative oxidoreductase [Fomitopsis betulina]